ncbi:MAG TPA: hypothetical protein VGE45_06790 [Chloroflexia bacterium]|jgi:hypothetical protein
MDATREYAYPRTIKFIKGMKSVRDDNRRCLKIALAWTVAGLIFEVALIGAIASTGRPVDIFMLALGMIVPLEMLFLVVFNASALSYVRSDADKLTYAMECKAYLQSVGYSEARLKIASSMADEDRKIIQTRYILTGVALALLLAFSGAVIREPTTPIALVALVAFAFVLVIGRYAADAEQELADVVLQQAASLCREDIIREEEEQEAQEKAEQSQSQRGQRSGWM